MGVEREKEKHPGFARPVIMDGFLLRNTDGQGRRDGEKGGRKGGRRGKAREVLWLLVGLSLTKGQRRIPILF